MSQVENIAPQFMDQFFRILRYILSVNNKNIRGEGMAGRMLSLTQLGSFFGQALFSIRTELFDTLQLTLAIWKLQLGMSITFTRELMNHVINDRVSTKEVTFQDDHRIYARFIGYEGVGIHLCQITSETGSTESVSLGLHPLSHLQFRVDTFRSVTSASVQFSFAYFVLKAKISFLNPSHDQEEE